MSSAIVPTSRKYYSIFDPSKLTDCNFWLDASNTSSITLNGSNVSQWNDLSGSGNHATQATTASQPTVSGNFVVFSSNRFLTVPYRVLNNQNSFSIYIVLNPISASNWILTRSVSSTTTYNWISTGRAINSTNSSISVAGGLNIGLDTLGTYYNVGNTITTSTVQLLEIYANEDNIVHYKNGEQIRSRNSKIGGYQTYVDTVGSSRLGVFTVSGVIQNSGLTNFQLGEMLIFSNSLSSQHRDMVSRFLMNKWGIKTEIELFYRYFSPIDIPSCALWFDASDISTMYQDTAKTQPVTADGQNVKAIVDKASGNTLTNATNFPTVTFNALNGLSALSCQSTKPLSISLTKGVAVSSLSTSLGVTIIGVYKYTGTTSGSAGSQVFNVYNSASVLHASVGWTSYSTQSQIFAGARLQGIALRRGNTGASDIATLNVITSAKYDCDSGTGTAKLYFRGDLVTASTITGVTQTTGNPGSCNIGSFNGLLYECIFYNRCLLDSELNQIHAYLSKKWNITLVTSTNQLKYNPQLPKFSLRNNMQDCINWLDAADPNGDGTLPSVGSSVSSWQDKSVKIMGVNTTSNNIFTQRSFTQATAANQPIFTYDGNYPGIYFDGSSKYMMDGGNFFLYSRTSLRCIFFVCRTTTLSTSQVGLMARRNNTSYYKITPSIGNNSDANMFITFSTTITTNCDITFTNSTETKIYVISNTSSPTDASNSNNMFYVNGVNVNPSGVFTGTTAEATSTSGTSYLGCDDILSNFFTGYIFELIHFGRFIAEYERQTIEGYLAWKWGIQGSLPSTHPFAKYPPS